MSGPPNPNGAASPGSRTIIPLMPGVARPRGERRVLIQEAVVEVVRHLVLKAVPPEQRSPLFDQARDLLTEAGWGLDELFEAAEDGPARQRPVPGARTGGVRPGNLEAPMADPHRYRTPPDTHGPRQGSRGAAAGRREPGAPRGQPLIRQRDAPALTRLAPGSRPGSKQPRPTQTFGAVPAFRGTDPALPARFSAGELVHSRRIREESVATDGCSKRKRSLPRTNQLNRPGVPGR